MKRALVAAVAVALALSLAACSEDEPRLGPSETTSPSTPDTSPTEPPDKEPWEKNTRAGAVAFAEHWFEVFSDAMGDGDVADLRSISAPKCATCNTFADRLESIYDHGGFYESEGWSSRKTVVGTRRGLPNNERKLLAKIDVAAERFRERSSAPVVKNGKIRIDATIRVRWTDAGWIMTELVQLR